MSRQPSSPLEIATTVRIDPQNPWPGLVPYAEEHAAFFFGREEDVAIASVEKRRVQDAIGHERRRAEP